MSLWDKLVQLIGIDVKGEKLLNTLVNKVSDNLLDYQSTKYETIFLSWKELSSKTNILGDFTRTMEQLFKSVSASPYRVQRYRLYEGLIESLPELNEALQTYVDNILAPDDYTKSSLLIHVPPHIQKREVEPRIRSILETFDVENKLRLWVEKTLLYGDYFIEIVSLSPNIVKESILVWDIGRKEVREETEVLYESITTEEGHVTLVGWDPHYVVPITLHNNTFGYVIAQPISTTTSVSYQRLNIAPPTQKDEQTILPVLDSLAKQIITKLPHLKKHVEEDSNLKASLWNLLLYTYLYESPSKVKFRIVDNLNMIHFSIPSALTEPYGRSLIDRVSRVARYLVLSEFALLVYRLTRAPERRVFKVEVGRSKEVANILQKVITKVKQKETFLQDPTSLDTLLSEMNLFEDFFVPVVDGKEFFSVDTLPPGELTAKIEDIEYLRKKLISGLGIPAIYLIQEESSESKYTLSQENIKFARTIVNLQKIVSTSVTELVTKLATLLFEEERTINAISQCKVLLRPPLAIQMERLGELTGNITNLVNSLAEIMPTLDKEMLAKRFLTYFFDPTELEEMIRVGKLTPKAGSEGGEEGFEVGTEEVGEEKKGEGLTPEEGGGGLF